jgi:hypothetical protein
VNRSIVFVLAFCLIGATGAPTALITGSVRDQNGAPITGASVSVPGQAGQARTDADGTFALDAAGERVQIRCRYCRPTQAPVAADGTVVAIVRRYTALTQNGPSSDDIAALPYAHIESDLALTPFVQLEDSRAVIPGPQLSDRGSQRGGGLILDAGIPNYDVIANVSPFLTIPQHYIQNATAAPTSDAYLYGDLADGGTYALDAESESRDGVMTGGADGAIRLGVSNAIAGASAGLSRNQVERRERADGSLLLPLLDGTVGLQATASEGRTTPYETNEIYASYAAVHASYERTRTFTLRVDAYGDRGTYEAASQGLPLRTDWSDTGAAVTVRSNATVAPFATFGVRSSTGFYDAEQFGIARFGATLGQAQATAGVHASGSWYDVLAAFGADDASYTGGVYGLNFPKSAQTTAPLLRIRVNPNDRWSLTASTSGGFLLPTLLTRYSVEPPYNVVYVDRDVTHEATVEYTDGARVRFALTGLQRYVKGMDNGRVGSIGASVAWQVAPEISLRASVLRSTPSFTSHQGVRFGARPLPATTGSIWLTYDLTNALRFDGIWRQDLLDYRPDAHLDASVSAPLARNLRWFVGSERRLGVRYTDVGLRFAER